MRTFILSLLLAGAAAFMAPVGRRSSTKLNGVSPELESMNGYDVETFGKPWDPLGISDFAPLELMREAELKHSRVAMLAILGWGWPEAFGIFPAGDITSTHAWEAIAQCDPQFWFQFIGLCGIVEAADFRHKSSGAEKPFWDPAGIAPKDPEEFNKMQLKELKNGRLAMLAIAASASAHYIPGSVPGFPFPH